MSEIKTAPKPDEKMGPKVDLPALKPDEKQAKETVLYEQREAIMGCGCRIIMDATTYDAEGAHCEVHDNTTVVRVIKLPPVEIEVEAPPARDAKKNGGHGSKPGGK